MGVLNPTTKVVGTNPYVELYASGIETLRRSMTNVNPVLESYSSGVNTQLIDFQNQNTIQHSTFSNNLSGVNTLAILDQTNINNLISYTSGIETLRQAMPRALNSLSADTTYYIRTDGNDNNNGLTNNSTGAFLTLQGAMNYITSNVNAATKSITIQIADGVYSGVALYDVLGDTATYTIQGNATNVTNVIILGQTYGFFSYGSKTPWIIKNVKIISAGYGLLATQGNIFFSGIEFGPCVNPHMQATYGGYIQANGHYRVTGSAYSHMAVIGAGGQINVTGKNIIISGYQSFPNYFATTQYAGVLYAYSNTFTILSGVINATKYFATANSVIHTNGGGANYFPGIGAGSTSTGGQYV